YLFLGSLLSSVVTVLGYSIIEENVFLPETRGWASLIALSIWVGVFATLASVLGGHKYMEWESAVGVFMIIGMVACAGLMKRPASWSEDDWQQLQRDYLTSFNILVAFAGLVSLSPLLRLSVVGDLRQRWAIGFSVGFFGGIA